MERYQVILAYDGSNFKGFQRQASVRSVQGVVEAALRKLNWQGKSILVAGRTDNGTHATGQVVAFDIEWRHDPLELRQALNKHLPSDVVASAVIRVKPGFHPRYDASWRRYIYRIYCAQLRHPLNDRYAWRVWPPAEPTTLVDAARMLIGTHDFSAFGTPSHSGGNTVRRVLESSWKAEGSYLVYEIKAQAFLYHMVRRIVFMQVSIAQGKLDWSRVFVALEPSASGFIENTAEEEPGQKMVHGLAPACGLVLAEVHYPPEALRISEDDIENEKLLDSQFSPIS